MASTDLQNHRLVTIEQYFVDMLGGRALTESQKGDMRRLAASIRLSAADPFWSIVAFLYARSPNDTLDMERLRKTVESLHQFREDLDSKLASFSGEVENLAKCIPEITKASVQEVLQGTPRDGSVASASIDDKALETLHAKIKADIEGITSKPTLKEWLGERWHHVLYAFGGVIGLLVVSVLGAYWIGNSAGEAAGKSAALQQASAIEKFIGTIPADDRRHMLEWMNLNRGQLKAITSCNIPGWVKKDEHNGYIACFPQGGHGFYAVTDQGLFGKTLWTARAYLP